MDQVRIALGTAALALLSAREGATPGSIGGNHPQVTEAGQIDPRDAWMLDSAGFCGVLGASFLAAHFVIRRRRREDD